MTGDHGIPDLYVRTSRNAAGDFVIEGQHLGAGLGRDDYEYYITVKAADLPSLATALGTDTAGIDAAWAAQSGEIVRRGENRWLEEHGVPKSLYVI